MTIRNSKQAIPGSAKRKPFGNQRRGVVLLIVLVVVAAFSVAAYAMSHQMLTELSIVKAKNRSSQQRLLAESATEHLLASDANYLATLTRPPGSTPADSSSTYNSIQATNFFLASGQFAVLRSIPLPGEPIRHGLNNESAKLNLNSLTSDRYSRKQVLAKLTRYKDLSESTATGIADLLGVFDATDKQTPSSSETPPLGGRLTSLLPLLQVPGVRESLLFGEDSNRNGMLDPNENDGNLSFPPDNANGQLDAGWSAHWTLTGAESNLRRTDRGTVEFKINLNQPDLVRLYDQLLDFATPEQARFVVAWRRSSPTYTDTTSDSDRPSAEEITEQRKRTLKSRVAQQMGLTRDELGSGNVQRPLNADTVRAGIDLGSAGRRKLNSLLDLASCQLQMIIAGEDTVLVSPFANDPTSMAKWLPLWQSNTCMSSGGDHIGRINLLQASQETLETVDGISPQLAKQIVSQRAVFHRETSKMQTVGWLMEAGIVTSAELRKINDEITMGGCVFTGVVLGQLDRSRTANAIYIELDGRGLSRRLRRALDLPPLTYQQRVGTK